MGVETGLSDANDLPAPQEVHSDGADEDGDGSYPIGPTAVVPSNLSTSRSRAFTVYWFGFISIRVL